MTEQEHLGDLEQILKHDSQMGDEASKVKLQLEAHKVSMAKMAQRTAVTFSWMHCSYHPLFLLITKFNNWVQRRK